MASGPEKCPVDHGSFSAAAADKCPVDHKSAGSSWTSIFSSSSSSSAPISSSTSSSSAAGASIEKCPVDHKSVGSSWTSLFSSSTPSVPTSTSPSPPPPPPLTQDREVSSIPKLDGTNWVYPSQAQFFSAMARKNHHPQASDMRVIVPIHNAVNERAWAEILGWEEGQGGEGCGGVRLVSFKGRPRERTPRARWKMLLGYSPPFDRHDWVVDRCGTRTRYIIDFYTGRADGPAGNLSFYLDVRPALDNWDGVRLRAERFWSRWVGQLWNAPSPRNAEPAAAAAAAGGQAQTRSS